MLTKWRLKRIQKKIARLTIECEEARTKAVAANMRYQASCARLYNARCREWCAELRFWKAAYDLHRWRSQFKTWRHSDGSVRVDHMDARPGDYYGVA